MGLIESSSRAEQPYQVLAPMAHVKDLHTTFGGPIDDDISGSGYDGSRTMLVQVGVALP